MKLIYAVLFALSSPFFLMAQEGPQYQISIYFGGGSYYISQEQQRAIEEFIQNIPNVEQFNITIHSHTDNIGGGGGIQQLAIANAQSVGFRTVTVAKYSP